MSYTELHTGKLRAVRTGMSLEELKTFIDVNGKLLNIYVEDFEEKLEDEADFIEVLGKGIRYKEDGYWRFIYNKGTLYEVINHKGGESEDYIDVTTKNQDGTVDFTYLFYNGGTCFSEMLEEGLNKLK